MKKKSILVFLLALVSTASLGAVACKKAEEHQHNWSYKSNNDLHWQNCGDCDAAKDFGVHNDADKNGSCDVCGAGVSGVNWLSDDNNHWVDNNGDKVGMGGHVDENDDGHCDTCDYVYKVVVTFDAKGVCDVAPVSVDHGATVTAPTVPVVQGWVFAGWYSDADFKIEFDFTKPITFATTVYAKFNEDTTPGSNANHAIPVTRLDAPTSYAFGNLTKLYFKYTATETNRFSAFMGAGAASEACSFVTDLDDNATTNVDTQLGMVHFDLNSGDSVVIEVSRGAGVTDTANVGVCVVVTNNEPLPAEGWASGEYISGTNKITLDTTAKTATWNSFAPANFTYVGGVVDKLTFSVTSSIASGTFTVTRNDDGTFTVSCTEKMLLSGDVVFEYHVPIAPIPIEKFSGIYTLDKGGFGHPMGGNTVEIGIYANGNGYLLSNNNDRYSCSGSYAVFDQDTNTLNYANYNITLNINDAGVVTGITVVHAYGEATQYLYVRTGDAGEEVPESFAELTDGTTYAGTNYYFNFNGTYTYFGSSFNRIILHSYVSATHTYTVKVGGDMYTVVINGEDDVSIQWKNADGTELLDTLTKYVVSRTLPTESTDYSVAPSDFKNKLYHITVETAGWYTITTGQTNLAFYELTSQHDVFNVSELDPLNITDSVYLSAGTTLAVSNASFTGDNVPATFAFTIAPGQPAKGRSENNPITMEGINVLNIGSMLADTQYYAKFTLPRAGKYRVTVSYEPNWGGVSYMLYYTLNGDSGHGYSSDNGWVGGVTSGASNVSIQLDKDLNLMIVISHSSNISNDVTIRIEEDYSTATEISFADSSTGKLNASGAYRADISKLPFANNLTLTSETGFSLTVGGETNNYTTYTLTQAQLDEGFYLNLAAGADVDYELTYSEGAEQNPIKITELGSNKINVLAGASTYVTVTAPADKNWLLSLVGQSAHFYQFTVGNKVYSSEEPYYLAAGQSVTIAVSGVNSTIADTANLAVELDYTNDAVSLSFTTLPLGNVIIHFANNAAVTNSNFILVDTLGSDVTVTSTKAFTVNYPDGKSVVARLTGSSYVVTIPANDGMLFNITATEAADIIFALSYELGSQGNPHTVTFDNNLRYTSPGVATRTKNYFILPAGTYTYSSSINVGTWLYVNDLLVQGNQFDVPAGATVRFENNSRYSATLTLSPATPASIQGIFNFTDGTTNGQLTIGATTVKIGETVYKLSAVNGNVYTFTNGTGSAATSITITNGNTLLYGELALTPNTIPASIVGTYKGSVLVFGGEIIIKINADYTAVVNNQNVTLTLNGDTYSFSWNNDSAWTNPTNCTFTVTDGTLSLRDGYYASQGLATLTLTKQQSSLVGTYSGAIGAATIGNSGTLVINADGTCVYSLNNGAGLTERYSGNYTENGGTYTFGYSDGDYTNTVTFSVNDDGTLDFFDDYYSFETHTTFSKA